MSWEDLRYLEALSRAGTTPAAARELGVSASTVYRRLAVLEEEVGSPCLLRGSSPPQLTETGARLLKLAQHTREGMAEIRRHNRHDPEEISGQVGLTTVEAMLPVLLAPLKLLQERYPKLSIELILSESGPSVRKHEIDLSISVMANPPEVLFGRRLFQVEFGVFGTQAALDREPRRWLVSAPPIHLTAEAEWEQQRAEHLSIATGSRMAMLQMLREGMGVALFPKGLARPYPELIELTEFRPSIEAIPARYTWLLVHPDQKEIPAIRAVFDTLASSLAE